MLDDSGIDAVVRARVREYVRRATLLRQIHSNKGSAAQRNSRWYLVVTVLIASVVSVIGFMSPDRLAASISRLRPVSAAAVAEVYSFAVLAILVAVILGLIYRFDERSSRHYRSVEILTDFIRDAEDAVALSESGVSLLSQFDLNAYRERYKGMLAALPPSTDQEYLKAKRSAAEKATMAKQAEASYPSQGPRWADSGPTSKIEPELGCSLAELLSEEPRLETLQTVRDVLGEGAWVAGGFIRESVWDFRHGYRIPTPVDDIDIIYFDAANTDKSEERSREEQLRRASANVAWSVKNQARMHVVSGDEPYASLEEAVTRFPETATSVACQVGPDDEIRLLAPYGLEDLFALQVRPTPGFDLKRYQARLQDKAWSSKWPKLIIHAALPTKAQALEGITNSDALL